MTFENLVLELDGRLAILTLNRPRALNALNRATLLELDAALDALEQQHSADVLILTGAGPKSFVAGADIAEMKEMDRSQALAFARLGQRVFLRLQRSRMLVIAAVNGFALGGGCELALACDLILASETARFGQPEVNLGVIPGFGGTQRLARRVGPQWAKHLIASAEIIKADEAARIGLALRVYPAETLLEEARKLGQTVASKGMWAVSRAKQVIDEGLDQSLEAGLELEAQGFAACFDTADQKEGMSAFLEKRSASFRGA